MLWSPNPDLRDLLSIIEGDAGLTASVLRAANSSFSAPTGAIRTAAVALDRVGVDAAKQIMTAAFTRSEFENLHRSDLHFEDYWSWQLVVALLTEAICLVDGRPADELEAAFTAGLLHQVGRLSLIARNPEGYRAVLELASTGVDPLEAEWQTLGDDAAHVTAQVATHWDFFEPLRARGSRTGSASRRGDSRVRRGLLAERAGPGTAPGRSSSACHAGRGRWSRGAAASAPVVPPGRRRTDPAHAASAVNGPARELTGQLIER